MTEQFKSNGFGSFELFLVFTVENSKSQIVTEDDWEHIENIEFGHKFKFYFSARKRGDDETALFELLHSLPQGISIEDIKVDWDQSVF